MGKMAVESKTFPAGTAAIPGGRKVRAAAYRRYFVWAQIIIAFLFLEFALWAPTPEIRNRWAAIAAITILVLVLVNVLIGGVFARRSLARLGWGCPNLSGAGVVVGFGCATAFCMVFLVSWAGGQIPAN